MTARLLGGIIAKRLEVAKKEILKAVPFRVM